MAQPRMAQPRILGWEEQVESRRELKFCQNLNKRKAVLYTTFVLSLAIHQ